MENPLSGSLSELAQSKLNHFKEYAISHPHLTQVDMLLMSAIREPAGFAHVLIYGPSGVGKTTMIRQITKRLNLTTVDQNGFSSSLGSSYHNGNTLQVPLLLVETRPSDGVLFNRADYYRTALKLLGEPFYERRTMVDINAGETWEKKGRGRTKAAQFNDSPELRQALEEAMNKRGVRAVILDEAQHLMKIGSGASGGKLLDQLDWIKSMTNVTGVLHILIGTYELLNFRNLSGQASRRGLDIHFPRYLFQHDQDRQDFQAVLLALLKQVPLETDIPALMQHWVYFYERSIGCVGVLKDWLIRTVATALHDGSDTLTLERLSEHTLSLAQCERMAIEATEGEQKLSYMESRREHLWHLLQMGMNSTSVPAREPDLVAQSKSSVVNDSPPKSKTTRQKRSLIALETPPVPTEQVNTSEPKKRQPRRKKETPLSPTPTTDDTQSSVVEVVQQTTEPKKRQSRRKKETPLPTTETIQESDGFAVETVEEKTEPPSVLEISPKKNSSWRVGERKPQRDPLE